MNVLICEGKNDACFIDEIMKERFNGRKHTIYDHNFDKLQEMLGTNCKFIRTRYSLIIYGDRGKPNIEKELRRIVVETLGKYDDDLYINMIRDDDGVPYETLNQNLHKALQSLLKDKSKFMVHFPNIECNDDLFILKHPRSKGLLKVRLLTVPSNLEKMVVKKIAAIKCPHDSEILKELENNAHIPLELLANKYYSGKKCLLIRDSSTLLKNEAWVNDINRFVN
ncbi:Uncharacterised protein [uncultured archaeon]|nr:Uncharacterised protein [uncultured archaeon]